MSDILAYLKFDRQSVISACEKFTEARNVEIELRRETAIREKLAECWHHEKTREEAIKALKYDGIAPTWIRISWYKSNQASSVEEIRSASLVCKDDSILLSSSAAEILAPYMT